MISVVSSQLPTHEQSKVFLEQTKVFLPSPDHRNNNLEGKGKAQLLLIDILRAYFNAVTPEDERTYVELPPEFGAPPGTCAVVSSCPWVS